MHVPCQMLSARSRSPPLAVFAPTQLIPVNAVGNLLRRRRNGNVSVCQKMRDLTAHLHLEDVYCQTRQRIFIIVTAQLRSCPTTTPKTCLVYGRKTPSRWTPKRGRPFYGLLSHGVHPGHCTLFFFFFFFFFFSLSLSPHPWLRRRDAKPNGRTN